MSWDPSPLTKCGIPAVPDLSGFVLYPPLLLMQESHREITGPCMECAIDSNSLAAIHADSYIILVSLFCIIDDHEATILFCLIADQLQTSGNRQVIALS